MVALKKNEIVAPDHIETVDTVEKIKTKSVKIMKENMFRTLLISSLALVMLIKRVMAQNNNNPAGIVRIGPTRHVVPRTYNPGWYPMWDAHYTNNFYVASGKDDISWGRERHTDNEDADRSERRVWIEAIQDHEGFS